MPPKPPNPVFAFFVEIICFIILLPVLILRITIPYCPITFESIIFVLLPPLIILRRILRYARMLLFSRPGEYQDFKQRLIYEIDKFFGTKMKMPTFPAPEGLDCAPASFPALAILSVMHLFGPGNLFEEEEIEAREVESAALADKETIQIKLKHDLDRTITTMRKDCVDALNAAFGSCEDSTSVYVNEVMPFIVMMLAARAFENTHSRRRRANDLCLYIFQHAVDEIRQVHKGISRTSMMGRMSFVSMIIINLVLKLLSMTSALIGIMFDGSVYSKAFRNPRAALSSLWRRISGFLFWPIQNLWNTIETREREGLARLWSFHFGVTQLLAQLVVDLAEHGDTQQLLREEICEALVEAVQTFEKINVWKLKGLDDFIVAFENGNLDRQETQPATTKDILVKPNITPAPSVTRLKSMGDLEYDWTLLDDPRSLTPPESPEESRSIDDDGTCVDQRKSAQHSTNNFAGLNFHHSSMMCSGRDFAFTETKVILAYLLLHFEFELKRDDGRQRRSHRGSRFGLETQAEVVFRARK